MTVLCTLSNIITGHALTSYAYITIFEFVNTPVENILIYNREILNSLVQNQYHLYKIYQKKTRNGNNLTNPKILYKKLYKFLNVN